MQYQIFVIGAGGTGTYFLKEFSRFLSGNRRAKNQIAGMCIFDGDEVEAKNLARQAFDEEDIGRNKAVAMAEILNASFDLEGIEYEAYACYLNSLEQIKSRSGTVPVIISCVDNHGCRLLLEEYFNRQGSCIYFDSANEFDTGEVVYSIKSNGVVSGPVRSYFFPHIKEGDVRTREELSCEELNNVAPQHIFTNMTAGNLLCSGMANLLEGNLTPGVVFFNSLSYSMNFKPWKGGEVREEA